VPAFLAHRIDRFAGLFRGVSGDTVTVSLYSATGVVRMASDCPGDSFWLIFKPNRWFWTILGLIWYFGNGPQLWPAPDKPCAALYYSSKGAFIIRMITMGFHKPWAAWYYPAGAFFRRQWPPWDFTSPVLLGTSRTNSAGAFFHQKSPPGISLLAFWGLAVIL